MVDEQLEFQLTQYLDGTLAAPEIAALERRLADDAELRRTLEQYRALDAALHAERRVPAFDADLLAAAIAGRIDEHEAGPASYRLPWVARRLAPMAAAAAVILGLGWLAWPDRRVDVPTVVDQPTTAPSPTVVAVVAGPAEEPAVPPQTPTLVVSVGQPPQLSPALIAQLFVARDFRATGRVELAPAKQQTRESTEP